ncbi:slit homolog 1 protein-like [Uloborus diversus]|uniref:slit homolog 1 protein-like n=1 Tax=Uloborus diversus TaxID=327109 RepID=UPI00240A261D|nr:slit homolog 1 protein-like [Uloborus diversus]
MNKIVFLILASASILNAEKYAHRRDGCPTDIAPCSCINSVLECSKIFEPYLLENVFEKSVGYSYNEVHLKYSVLQYLPSEVFKQVPVRNLYLKNVTLIAMFDAPVSTMDSLDKIHIEDSIITRQEWDLLAPMKQLRLLTIYSSKIPRLEEDFGENMPSSLEQITFYGTETKTLKEGVFRGLSSLNKIAIDAAYLTELKRTYFPVPFNVKVLYFNDNKLTFIPDDLFTQMPYLQTVGLRQNQLITIPAAAFEGRASRITYVVLEENPLLCDCQLSWLIKDKPKVLSGTCAMPTKLQGQALKDLTLQDLGCL